VTHTVIVYVHGLWLSGREGGWLRRRLAQDLAAETLAFSYPSVGANATANAHALKEFLTRIRADTLHLVGHSLGGLVILKLFEDAAAAKQAPKTAIVTHAPLEHFARYIMADGRTRALHTRAIPLADASGQVTGFVGFHHDITEQKRVEDDLRRLSRELLTLRTEEQRRVARELHETTSQTLTALKMTLKQIEDSLPQDDRRARELAKSSRTLTSDAIREVRTLSSLLHPPVMDEAGLTVGLSSYVRLFSERSGVAVDFDIPDNFQHLPKELELALFCVAQESLANVHRHPKARAVEISTVRTAEQVSLAVRDDGIGMALPSRTDRRNSLLGIGIAGMRERVNQLQGEFHIHSSPGKGTTIQVTLPLIVEERSE